MTKQEMLAYAEAKIEEINALILGTIKDIVCDAWDKGRESANTDAAEEFAREIVELTNYKLNTGWRYPEKELAILFSDDFEQFYGPVATCPKCDIRWLMSDRKEMHFCPGCGRPVKWSKENEE